MEGLEVLKNFDLDFMEISEILLSIMAIPVLINVMFSMEQVIGCLQGLGVMAVYFLYTMYLTFTGNTAVGVLLSISSLAGMLGVVLRCRFPPGPDVLWGAILGEQCELKIRESLRDLALVTSSEEAVATVTSTLSACFSG